MRGLLIIAAVLTLAGVAEAQCSSGVCRVAPATVLSQTVTVQQTTVFRSSGAFWSRGPVRRLIARRPIRSLLSCRR